MVENTEPLPAERASEDSASISSIGQSPVDQLLALLETEYVVLLTRLSAHVRSPDVAAEIIHDVYVKLRSEPAISEIHSPRAYLYRMAVNFAKTETGATGAPSTWATRNFSKSRTTRRTSKLRR